MKEAELWAAENHEYLYLWDAGCLDEELVDEMVRRTLADGEPRVRPHSQHMYTYLTVVTLYDSARPEALNKLKKQKRRREYKLSLHGWMEFRIAAAVLDCGVFAANRPGRETAQFLEQLAQSVSQKSIKRGEEKLT